MTTTTLRRMQERTSPVRQYVMGVFFLVLAAVIWFGFGSSLPEQTSATFTFELGRSVATLAPWHLAAPGALRVLAALCAAFGAFQLARGFGNLHQFDPGLGGGTVHLWLPDLGRRGQVAQPGGAWPTPRFSRRFP